MEKKKINVLGKQIAYLEAGEGDPIVLQHGNPTCSYMWRNVICPSQKLIRDPKAALNHLHVVIEYKYLESGCRKQAIIR